MLDTGGRDNDSTGLHITHFVSDLKTPATFQHEVEFISAFVRVRLLFLSRLKAIHANHAMLALPERRLVEPLLLYSHVLSPVVETVHQKLLLLYCKESEPLARAHFE